MLKNAFIYAALLMLFSVVGFTIEKPYPMGDEKNTLMIADFDTWEEINNLGGMFSSWTKDPNDDTQGCRVEISDQERVGDKGNCLRLVYDVDSPKNAFNGMWIMLENSDWTPYKYLVLSVKGEKESGFTPRFKIEVKNRKGETGRYVVLGIVDQWKQFLIPVSSFRGLTKLKDMREMTIVFDDMRCNPKVGAVYVDNIYLSK
ncbi:MAG: carbohydrate binding domain-containing protein [Elusimicrobiota bacterium]